MSTQIPPRPAEDERRGTLRGAVDGARRSRTEVHTSELQ